MNLKQISKTTAVFCILTIWIIKFWIRPNFIFNDNTHFFLGIAPNLIGSFCLVFIVYWLLENYFFLFQSIWDVQLQMLLYFSLLVVNELLQLFPFFGRTFDWNDILFSAIGLGCSYAVFGFLYKKQLVVENTQLL